MAKVLMLWANPCEFESVELFSFSRRVKIFGRVVLPRENTSTDVKIDA
jgi:hypothetical protein